MRIHKELTDLSLEERFFRFVDKFVLETEAVSSRLVSLMRIVLQFEKRRNTKTSQLI